MSAVDCVTPSIASYRVPIEGMGDSEVTQKVYGPLVISTLGEIYSRVNFLRQGQGMSVVIVLFSIASRRVPIEGMGDSAGTQNLR